MAEADNFIPVQRREPGKSKKSDSSKRDFNLSFIEKFLETSKKEKVKPLEAYREQQKTNKLLEGMSDNQREKVEKAYLIYDNKRKAEEKLRKEILKEEYKQKVKKKWYDKIDKVNKLLDRIGGSWLTEIIGFLLAMAIFDPKGKILGGIIDMIGKFLGIFIGLIARVIPPIIKKMFNVLFNVLPDLLKKVLTNVFVAFGLSKDNPILQFLNLLTELVPYYISFLVALKAYTYILKGLMWIQRGVNALTTAFTIIQGWYSTAMTFMTTSMMPAIAAIWAFIAPILLIVAVIVVVVIAIWALWKWKDKIAGFFEGIFAWFDKFGMVGKIFGTYFKIIVAPIYGLVKLFQSVAKVGWKKTLLLIWEWIKKTALKVNNAIGRFVKDLPGNFLKWLKETNASLGGWFKDIGGKIWDFLKEWVFQPLKDFWNDIVSWIDGIARIGLMDYLWLDKGESKELAKVDKQMSKLEEMEEAGVDISKIGGIAKVQAAMHDEDKLKDLLKELAKDKTGNKGKTEENIINKLYETFTKKREVAALSKKLIPSARGGY